MAMTLMADASAAGPRPLRRLPTCEIGYHALGGEGVRLGGWEGWLEGRGKAVSFAHP